MTEKHLFFDWDGMKFNTIHAQIHYINKTYGLKITVSDYIQHNYDPVKLLPSFIPNFDLTPHEVYLDFGKNFQASIEAHERIEPMPGMCEVMPLLSKLYTIHTVTARQTFTLPVIEYIHDKYIPGCVANIHCVYERTDDDYIAIPKKEYIRNVEGEKVAFFDDNHHEIKDMKHVIPSYLFDPHSLYKSSFEYYRVKSWMRIWQMLK